MSIARYGRGMSFTSVQSMASTTPSPSPSHLVVEIQQSGSPWWADLATAVVLLLAGAAITSFTTWRLSRRDERASDRRRWLPDITPAALGLLEHATSISLVAERLAASEIKNRIWTRVKERKMREQIRAFHIQMNPHFSLLLLTLPEDSMVAARRVMTLCAYIRNAFAEERAELAEELIPAMASFSDHARSIVQMDNQPVYEYEERFEDDLQAIGDDQRAHWRKVEKTD